MELNLLINPLPAYIEKLYKKQFGKSLLDDVRSIEIKDIEKRKRKAEKKEKKELLK